MAVGFAQAPKRVFIVHGEPEASEGLRERVLRELGWQAEETFETGRDRTIDWYLGNDWWWRPIREQKYGGDRLGTAA